MIALSILQPYAWLIVHGHKDIENRSWSTPRRGEFLVHAGKSYTRDTHVAASLHLRREFHIELPPFDQMPVGGVVGRSEIVGCVRDHDSPWKSDASWGFVLRNSKPLPFTPWRGQLGWFDISIELLRGDTAGSGELFA